MSFANNPTIGHSILSTGIDTLSLNRAVPTELVLMVSVNRKVVTRYETVLRRDQAMNPSYLFFALQDSYAAALYNARYSEIYDPLVYNVTFTGRGVIHFVSNDMLQHITGPDWRFYGDLLIPTFADIEGNLLYRVEPTSALYTECTAPAG